MRQERYREEGGGEAEIGKGARLRRQKNRQGKKQVFLWISRISAEAGYSGMIKHSINNLTPFLTLTCSVTLTMHALAHPLLSC